MCSHGPPAASHPSASHVEYIAGVADGHGPGADFVASDMRTDFGLLQATYTFELDQPAALGQAAPQPMRVDLGVVRRHSYSNEPAGDDDPDPADVHVPAQAALYAARPLLPAQAFDVITGLPSLARTATDYLEPTRPGLLVVPLRRVVGTVGLVDVNRLDALWTGTADMRAAYEAAAEGPNGGSFDRRLVVRFPLSATRPK